MAATKLTDVIVPELFNPYVVNRTMELSALVQSGIVSNNPEFDRLASQASPTINMPFFEDLTGESEQIIEDADLTAKKIQSNKDVAAIIRRCQYVGCDRPVRRAGGQRPDGSNCVACGWFLGA